LGSKFPDPGASKHEFHGMAFKGSGPQETLTARERECLLWLSRGLRNDDIAEKLSLSRSTVEFHLVNVRRKLNASTREQALAIAVHDGLITP
jgi:DNA-binding CsgD family transcriptional regulator